MSSSETAKIGHNGNMNLVNWAKNRLTVALNVA